jgi:hypothetical protein
MIRRSHVGISVFLKLVICLSLAGQSAEWLKNHDKKNRYEGLVDQNQASLGWEVRSFTGYKEAYPMDSSTNLIVKYFVLTRDEASVQAQTINSTSYYLMKAKTQYLPATAGWRRFDEWPTGDVLIPNNINSCNLGLVISVGKGSYRLAPAIIYHSSEPGNIQSYSFDFFTMRSLGAFSFDVKGAKGYKRAYKHSLGTGDRSTVHLEFDAAMIPEGWTTLRVHAPYANSPIEKLNLEIEFYNMPTQ